ncbi:putative ABC transporter [Emiliania huxleyi CCMP1516]|uniref:ABC transporter domain-containing protein n=2 Tax=Emiliania huxleyi TaxID=2903 RepID=A0A0D3K7Q3_EMIH1|nr:putative ABC transporter [Emiliania huxleyi CCMP1516]EOD31788.1 putative ABC transporter [Emiliania huxleyi CCMP1516]|eukprot:XP_005784217.1 putative ABC transporter [Emiliania huxleyi CCMP1516]
MRQLLSRLVSGSHEATAQAAPSVEALERFLAEAASAASASAATAAAIYVSACASGLGPVPLHATRAVPRLMNAAHESAEDRSAPHAREAAVLCLNGAAESGGEAREETRRGVAHSSPPLPLPPLAGMSERLGFAFEPLALPQLPQIVALVGDRDRKVGEAAVRTLETVVSCLDPLAALYHGMRTVSWHVKEVCLRTVGRLAARAPGPLGACMPECVPAVIECLNDSNAKVIPTMLSCVDNPETQSLKAMIVRALREPSFTLEAVDEILSQTFVNAMDGTSLAFLMPILLRGLRSETYELVKKAATCAGNMCALIVNGAELAPFLPELNPALEMALEHSSPAVRAEAATARDKLLEGVGELQASARKGRDVVSELLRTRLADALGAATTPPEVAAHMGSLGTSLLERLFAGKLSTSLLAEAPQRLAAELVPLAVAVGATSLAEKLPPVCEAAVEAFVEQLPLRAQQVLTSSDGKDYLVDVQNCILAFAGRVLLKKADIRFQRGHRYGLIGQNGVGKTTLLNRLSAGDIRGFPPGLNVHYIRHEVVCEDGVDGVLAEVGFTDELRASEVNNLSGGWKMKLSVAISILHAPELLLLDEPTNHLDRKAVEWLKSHLLSLTGVTMAIVSHDYAFIDEVCTDITHYDNGGHAGKPCRFVYYPMTFRQFQQLRPEIAAGLPASGKATGAADDGTGYVDPRTGRLIPWGDGAEPSDEGGSESGTGSALSTLSNVEQLVASGSILPIRFPDPGKPEGIRTYRKPVMTMKDIHFTYEGSERAIITSASVTVTLGSRVVMLGANGAGKTTLLKLLIGDLEPTEGVGEVWKHHNLRLAYIAQHSLHHLEEYLQQTPIAYIQERFRQGLDVELSKLKTLALTDDEKAIRDQTGAVKDVVGRQKRGKQVWYEVVKPGRKGEATQWYPLEEIETQFKPYVLKMVKNYDLKVQALESGLAVRPITSAEILEHLDDFGLGSDLAHGKIKQLSGGQRQRLVICAAFWSKPHLIALDEPTNYLDNDTLAALTQALKGFKGAVVTVSHNEDFVKEISNERWVVAGGSVTVEQLRDAKAR